MGFWIGDVWLSGSLEWWFPEQERDWSWPLMNLYDDRKRLNILNALSWSICIYHPPGSRSSEFDLYLVCLEKINVCVCACSIKVSDDEADSSEFRFTWFSFFSTSVEVVSSRCKWQIAYHIFVYLSSHVWTPLCYEMNIEAAHLNVWLIGAPLTLNRKHLNRPVVPTRCHASWHLIKRPPADCQTTGIELR